MLSHSQQTSSQCWVKVSLHDGWDRTEVSILILVLTKVGMCSYLTKSVKMKSHPKVKWGTVSCATMPNKIQ